MSRSVNMCVRVDPEIKEQAEEVLEQLGMNMNGIREDMTATGYVEELR